MVSGGNDGDVRVWPFSSSVDADQENQQDSDDTNAQVASPEIAVFDDTESYSHHRLTGHDGAITCLDVDTYGGVTAVTGSADRTLREWDLHTGQNTLTINVWWTLHGATPPPNPNEVGYGDYIGALQFWGAALACGTSDGIVRMWDLRTGQAHRALTGHQGAVTSLQFDQTHLVSGDTDGTVKVKNASYAVISSSV